MRAFAFWVPPVPLSSIDDTPKEGILKPAAAHARAAREKISVLTFLALSAYVT